MIHIYIYIYNQSNQSNINQFSILGMNLFGCKFCENVNDERVCDRKNFDSLLWALVTVFQVEFARKIPL